MYELILQSSTIGIILAIFMSCAMLVAINSPLWVFFIYILIRPLLFPYTQLQYTFFGLPLSAFPSLVLLIGAIKFSLLSKHGTLFIKNMNSLYLLLFIMLLSSFNSYNHSISFHFIVQYITAISLAVIAYNAVNKIEDFIILYKMIAVSSILPILFGLYEKYVVGINRIASVMAMENEYGIYLSLIIVVLIFLIINEKKKYI